MPKGDFRIVHEKRDTCSARAHDTARAWKDYRCRCPAAREDYTTVRNRYMKAHAEKIRTAARERARAKVRELGRDPSRTGPPGYEDMEVYSDWVMADRIVREGPQKDAKRYDKWVAITILTERYKSMTAHAIAKHVGADHRTVQRIRKWMRDNAKPTEPTE